MWNPNKSNLSYVRGTLLICIILLINYQILDTVEQTLPTCTPEQPEWIE